MRMERKVPAPSRAENVVAWVELGLALVVLLLGLFLAFAAIIYWVPGPGLLSGAAWRPVIALACVLFPIMGLIAVALRRHVGLAASFLALAALGLAGAFAWGISAALVILAVAVVAMKKVWSPS